MKFFDRTKDYAPIAVRYGVGIVFFLFGLSQLTRPEAWIAYFPTDLPFGLVVNQAIMFNGIFDLILGALLLLGLFTRLFAALAALHLIGVMSVLGYNDIAIRDFGLFLGSLSILFNGADKWSLDRVLRKNS
ncbi:DoxX family membrane protein [Candidatus Pacearchaeota archaeon]|nr:DoxX family membrane protein [Candidatus Pacearchaeota archaeon]